ncbi:MAG TPA: UTP--glucose-1-phosphate uridylyltransferase GalU [Atribacteraceae bacterium]|nr:UTP--glucose-1-phosphate uridylyltransferase GalU [Atribacteraceae bacterium]
MAEKSIRKALIPVAGFGTRLLPATKAQPKEMLPVVDTPAVQYVVEEALNSGVESLLFVTGRGKQAIENYFDYSVELEKELKDRGKLDLLQEVREVGDLIHIFYVRQKRQKGLGDAIWYGRQFIGDAPFAVLLADDIIDARIPCLAQMAEVYREFPGIVLAVEQVPRERVDQLGIIKGRKVKDRVFAVEDLVEKPDPAEAPSDLAIVGRYILTPSIFDSIEKTTPGKGGEIQLTDAMKNLIGRENVYAYQFEGTLYGVGDKLGFLKANIAYALKREDLGPPIREFIRECLDG